MSRTYRKSKLTDSESKETYIRQRKHKRSFIRIKVNYSPAQIQKFLGHITPSHEDEDYIPTYYTYHKPTIKTIPESELSNEYSKLSRDGRDNTPSKPFKKHATRIIRRKWKEQNHHILIHNEDHPHPYPTRKESKFLKWVYW